MYALLSLICITSFCAAFSFRSFKSGSQIQSVSSLKAVKEIFSIVELDQIVASARDQLVVIDYSTTWCGLENDDDLFR